MAKLHIKKGDTVVVISGNHKETGNGNGTGKVLKVLIDQQRAIVEGVNMVSKHTKPNAANPQGGILKKEAPIHISNLMIVDPKTGEPSRIGRKVVEVEGKNKVVRYAKKSGEEIK